MKITNKEQFFKMVEMVSVRDGKKLHTEIYLPTKVGCFSGNFYKIAISIYAAFPP